MSSSPQEQAIRARDALSIDDDEATAIGKALGFLASAVKSGEPWSEQCDAMKRTAFSALDSLTQRLRSRRSEETTLSDEPEALARRFHETYERLAPKFGYETREASAVPWNAVPDANRALMIATCAELLQSGSEEAGSGETGVDTVRELISALEDDIAREDMPNIRRRLTALKSAHQRTRRAHPDSAGVDR